MTTPTRAVGRHIRLLLLFAALLAIPAAEAGAQTTVYLVRHAEKETGTSDRDPALTEAGRLRAAELSRVLGEASIDAVLSTPFRRTLGTAGPVAARFGLEPIITTPGSNMIGDIARMLREDYPGQTVLVVGHSNTIPAIVNELAGSEYPQLGEDEYDDLFVVVIGSDSATALRLHYGGETP